jgi:hypothetical protein
MLYSSESTAVRFFYFKQELAHVGAIAYEPTGL